MLISYRYIFWVGMSIAAILIAPIYGCSKHAKPKLATFHSPYAERHCAQCHHASNTFASWRASQEKPTSAMEPKLAPNPWLLVLPLDQLCGKCHGYDDSQETAHGKLWIHAPSALGACIVCHSPHLSEYPYMLRRQSIRLCTDQCHSDGYMLETKVHAEPRHCLECHNPHFGMNAQLLKKDYQEVWLEPKTPWVEVKAGGKP